MLVGGTWVYIYRRIDLGYDSQGCNNMFYLREAIVYCGLSVRSILVLVTIAVEQCHTLLAPERI